MPQLKIQTSATKPWCSQINEKIFLNNNNNKIIKFGGSVVKNPLADAGDTGSVPDLGRSYVPQGN